MSFICEGIHHATVADIARLEGISLEDAAAGADKLAAVKAEPKANPGDDDSDADVNLKFDEFDIVGVLDTAAPLLASKVGDFDASTADDAKLTKKERLRLAKQALKERLGMAVKDDGDTSVKREEGTRALDVTKFVDVDDLVGEDDVEEKAAVKVEENRVDAADLSQLSARERNRLKRKQKRAARDDAEGAAAAAPASKKAKKGGEDAALAAAEAAEEEEEAAEVEAGAWPLTRTCESLAYSLFAARWEERHGAAAALREILRHHADAAAVLKPPARTTSLLLPPPPSPPNQTARGSRTWRCVCCACSPSIDSEITSAMAWSLPCARPVLRLWARGSFRFPPGGRGCRARGAGAVAAGRVGGATLGASRVAIRARGEGHTRAEAPSRGSTGGGHRAGRQGR